MGLDEHNKATNLDRIRTMSKEELAEWLLYSICKRTKCRDSCPILSGDEPMNAICQNNILFWLEQPEED